MLKNIVVRIKRNIWLLLITSLAINLWIIFAVDAGTTSTQKRTSIVMILADDLGYADPEYQSIDPVNGAFTPNLNALAFGPHSLKFDQFYSASSVCSPTRAAIISGRHPDRDCVSGANAKFDIPGKRYHENFPYRAGMPSIALEALRAGYNTSFFGKFRPLILWLGITK
jgi:arylsulfatase A-like enzyme